MSQSPVVMDVTEAEFPTAVLRASADKPVVVDFWAAWCGPCHQLSPLLERVAARYADDVEFAKVDVDAAPGVARTYRVQGIPAVKAFRDGQVVAEFVGVQPEATVERFFAALAPTPADRLVSAAQSAEDRRREELLREALAVQPGHVKATLALARLLVDAGDGSQARALLKAIPTDDNARRLLAELAVTESVADDAQLAQLRAAVESGDVASRVPLGRALAARGAGAEALDVLLPAVRDPATRADARAAVLQIFTLLGEDSQLVRTFRPRLASALF